MAKIKVAIDGFCRIGRSVFKIANNRADVDVVAIRTQKSPELCAYLLKYDSFYGNYSKSVKTDGENLIVGDEKIKIINEPRTAKLPWGEEKIDVLIDVDRRTDAAELRRHITAGARRVVSLSSCKDFPTVIMGVSDDLVDAKSTAICSGDAMTNCVAPILMTLDQTFHVEAATIVAIDGDSADKLDKRTSRQSDSSLVASRMAGISVLRDAIEQAQLNIVVDGVAVNDRANSSVGLVNLAILVREPATAESVNQTLAHAAREPLYNGILAVSDKELVAEDFRGNSYSSTIDSSATSVANGKLIQLVAWYDSEWASANRLVELTVDTGRFARNRR